MTTASSFAPAPPYMFQQDAIAAYAAIDAFGELEPISATVPCVRPIASDEIAPFMALVRQIAMRIHRKLPRSVSLDDLVAAGSIGLMDALRKFAGTPGAQFEWYARVRIRGAILDELRSSDWLTRRQRARADQTTPPPGAAFAMVGFDDLPFGDRQLPANDDSPHDAAERQSDRIALSKAVALLPERDARIVEMHYIDGVAFKDIPAHMKVSEPRISQLHSRAMLRLREIMSEAAAS